MTFSMLKRWIFRPWSMRQHWSPASVISDDIFDDKSMDISAVALCDSIGHRPLLFLMTFLDDKSMDISAVALCDSIGHRPLLFLMTFSMINRWIFRPLSIRQHWAPASVISDDIFDVKSMGIFAPVHATPLVIGLSHF